MDRPPQLAQQYAAAMKLQRLRDQGLPCSGCGATIPIPDLVANSVACPQCGGHEALADHVDGFTLEARRAYDDRVGAMEERDVARGRTDTIVIVAVVIGLAALCTVVFVFGK